MMSGEGTDSDVTNEPQPPGQYGLHWFYLGRWGNVIITGVALGFKSCPNVSRQNILQTVSGQITVFYLLLSDQ